MEVAILHSLVKPPMPINLLITSNTGISNKSVATFPSFKECGPYVIKILKDNCKRNSTICDFGRGSVHGKGDEGDGDDSLTSVSQRDIILVAQHGNRFDIPFLFK